MVQMSVPNSFAVLWNGQISHWTLGPSTSRARFGPVPYLCCAKIKGTHHYTWVCFVVLISRQGFLVQPWLFGDLLCWPGWPQTGYKAENGLELLILLPLQPSSAGFVLSSCGKWVETLLFYETNSFKVTAFTNCKVQLNFLFLCFWIDTELNLINTDC